MPVGQQVELVHQASGRVNVPGCDGVLQRGLSLAGDAAAARLIIDAQGGPVVLVGHSYGGAVITEAGTNPNVAALVYIAAFAPDKGESVNTLIAGFPPDGAAAADPAAEGRVLVPRPGQVPRPRSLVTCPPSGRVHGRLAGPVGSGRARWADH